MLKFYRVSQNNSGGVFQEPALYVYAEAETPEKAWEMMCAAGCYSDENYDVDCECCGTRWSEPWDSFSTDELDEQLAQDRNWGSYWLGRGVPLALILRADGTQEVVRE